MLFVAVSPWQRAIPMGAEYDEGHCFRGVSTWQRAKEPSPWQRTMHVAKNHPRGKRTMHVAKNHPRGKRTVPMAVNLILKTEEWQL